MITKGDRFDAVDKLFNELEQVACNPSVEQVPEIIERLMYLKKEGLAITYPANESAENTSDSLFVLISNYLKADAKNTDENSQIMFYPMFPEDTQFGRVCSDYVQRVLCSAYSCESNTIIINMSCLKETSRFLAHCFLHELGHAQIAKKEGRLSKKVLRSRNERCQEEINMWTTDYKLMLALGGKNYQKASRKMAFEIDQWWHQKKERPDHRGIGIALKYCFGNLSNADSNIERDLSFFVYCSFMAADDYLDKEKAKEKKLQTILETNSGLR